MDNAQQTVLVVDDESSIRETLEAVLNDEGYSVIGAADGPSALSLMESGSPKLALLDIWMPGMDGLELLSKIRANHPDTRVIMISGHATIATAIMATKLGAVDFIEKPLDLTRTLDAVKRALSQGPIQTFEANNRIGGVESPNGIEFGRVGSQPSINPLVFNSQKWPGREIEQRTLSRSAVLYGQGLHSGRKSGLILEPLPPNSGIHFVGVSDVTVVPALVDFVESTGYATTVKLENTQAGTIEHLMSALSAYRISNLLIKCNGEVPVMDGSAREFCSLIEEVGIESQGGGWFELAVQRPIRVGDDREYILIEPYDGFRIEYELSYPAPVGVQKLCFELRDVEAFKREIAGARTFGFVRDINALQKQGLALGGRFDNFVLFGEDGPINDALRYPNEPVRHKILDAIGDLYLLGRPLAGSIKARMTGHSDNIALLKAIAAAMV